MISTITTEKRKIIAKPFLKWAGGKQKLVKNFVDLFPSEINTGKIQKYVEPFIGGGALYFHIAQAYPQIKKFFISDINQELILVYKTIQNDVETLILFLEELEKEYHSFDKSFQKEFFYKQRKNFNEKLLSINFNELQSSWVERTAIIIFLNRTCFNGLFRVNSKGEFNVPFGDYKNPKICDSDNLRLVATLLQNTDIRLGDFSINGDFVDSSTFVYFDPPYRPLNKTSSFTSYSKFEFEDNEQIRLSNYYHSLSNKKAKLMLSNSDPKNENPDDNFFEDLYKGFRIKRVSASRMINRDVTKRGKIKELLIMNY
jgi:DNA adenine methylase